MILFNVKEKEYKLTLTTKELVAVENRLGHRNAVNVFLDANENKMPCVGDLLIILHGAMQKLNNGISLDDVYAIYDDYCSEGHSWVDLIQVLTEVFQDSNVIPSEGKN